LLALFFFGFEKLSIDVDRIDMILLVVVVKNDRIVFDYFDCVGLGLVFIIRCFVTVLIDSVDRVLPCFAI